MPPRALRAIARAALLTVSGCGVAAAAPAPLTAPAAAPPPSPSAPALPELSAEAVAKRWPRVKVLPRELTSVRALFTTLRNKDTSHRGFCVAADRLMRFLSEEGLATLPGAVPRRVTTPCGTYDGVELAPSESAVAVSIVRAGDSLLEAVRTIDPDIACGKILIQRDEDSAEKLPRLFYVKLPQDVGQCSVLLTDPMCATGSSAIMAIRELTRRGVSEDRIVFLNVVSCPEGLDALFAACPRVRVVTAAVDSHLDGNKYIVPGLGDYGDRCVGSREAARNAGCTADCHLHPSPLQLFWDNRRLGLQPRAARVVTPREWAGDAVEQ